MANPESLAQKSFERLRQAAFRHNGAATWIGVTPGPDGTVGPIGPEFYSGTAGVAFAVAQFAAHTSSETARTLARSAIEHALSHSGDVAPGNRLGFYAGWAGIIYAACVVADTLREDGLVLRVKELAAALAHEGPSEEFDVTSGVAGAVAGLALAAPVLGAPVLDTAMTLAETLGSRALHRPRWLQGAWRSPREKGCLPLTGFAHGSAGVAWALLELWALRPDAGWLRDLALEAFRYEDRTYQDTRGYWPDLRHYRNWKMVELLPPPSQAAWCHGAGGMSLARLRARDLTQEDRLRDAAIHMANHLAAECHAMWAGEADLCLCHGLPGNAIILAHVSAAADLSDLQAMALDLRAKALGRIGRRADRPTPMDPGLMLGEAGQLLFLIHASGGSIVSPLLPRPVSTV